MPLHCRSARSLVPLVGLTLAAATARAEQQPASAATPPASVTPAPASAAPVTPTDGASGAAAPTAPDAPAAAWQPTPSMPLQGWRAPPARPPPEDTRRTVELMPHLGLAAAHCHDGTLSDERCSGVGPGLDLGFGALWRFAPRFAWGGAVHLVPLRHEPASADRRDPRAFAAFLGLIGRFYWFEAGRLDPYLQLGIGGAGLGTAATEMRGARSDRYEETGAGVALQLGIGWDVILSRRFRLGPMIEHTRVFVDKIRRCGPDSAEPCLDLPKDQRGYLDSFTTVGARLTILVGEDL